MNDMDYFIIRVQKQIPAMAFDDFHCWIQKIKDTFMIDVKQLSQLSERLMWIWLAQHNVLIQNIENGVFEK